MKSFFRQRIKTDAVAAITGKRECVTTNRHILFFLIDMQIAIDYNIEVLTIFAMDESVSDSFAEVSSWDIFVYLHILRKEEVIQNKSIITP